MTEVEVERLVVRLVGDGSSFQRMIQQSVRSIDPAVAHIEAASRRIEGFSRGIQGFADTAVHALAGFGLATSFRGAFERFEQYERSQVRLRAVIEAGGHTVESVLPDYEKFTKSLMEQTLQTKASITAALQKAEVMGSSGDAAKELVKISVALSGVLGGEASQHIRIARMIKDGNFEYVKRILGLRGIKDQTELMLRVQGQLNAGWRIATEEGGTVGGRIEKLKRSFNELTLEMGAIISQALEPLVNWLTKATGWFKSLDDGTRNLVARVVIGTVALAGFSYLLSPVVIAVRSLLAPFTSLAMLLGTFAVRLAFYLPIQAAGLILWTAWKVIMLAWGAVTLANVGILAALNVVTALVSGGVLGWTALVAVAKVATVLWSAALAVLNVVLAPVALVAFTIALAAFAPLIGVVVGLVMGAAGAFTALRGGMRNIFADTAGPMKAIGGIFGEWWGILKDIVTAIKTDMPLAGKLMWAAFQLGISQVRDLWPPLWTFIKTSFDALWTLVTERFILEFKKGQLAVKEELAENASWLDTEEHKRNRKLMRDTLDASIEFQNRRFENRMVDANRGFHFEESLNTKLARNEVDRIREQLKEKLKGNDKVKDDPLGLNAQQEALKKTTHEMHKYDAALHGSAESIARIAEFRDKMRMAVVAGAAAGSVVVPDVGAVADAIKKPIQHDPEEAKKVQALVQDGMKQVIEFNKMSPEKQKEWIDDQRREAEGMRLANAITPYLKQLVELAKETVEGAPIHIDLDWSDIEGG